MCLKRMKILRELRDHCRWNRTVWTNKFIEVIFVGSNFCHVYKVTNSDVNLVTVCQLINESLKCPFYHMEFSLETFKVNVGEI